MKRLNLLLVVFLLWFSFVPVFAAIDVSSAGNSSWVAVSPSSNAFDYLQDQQTGSGSVSQDLVGDTTYRVFYMQLNDNGTTGDTSDDSIGFRFRINDWDSPGNTFQYYAFVGLDLDLNGSIDIFTGIYNPDNQGSKSISIYQSDPTKLNISPSTTGFGNRILLITPQRDVNWSIYATGDGSNFSGDTDYFLSFVVPLSSFNSALATINKPAITIDTPMRMVIGTAAQDNSYNQDMGGVGSGYQGSSTPWTELGVFMPLVTASGTVISNSAPVANDQTFTYTNGVGVNFTLTASDADNNTINWPTLTAPSGACYSITGPTTSGGAGVYTFTSNTCTTTQTIDFTVTDSYTITTGGTTYHNTSNIATLTFLSGSNVAPVANNVNVSVSSGSTTTFSLSASDGDGDTITYPTVTTSNLSSPCGTITGPSVLGSNGVYTYTDNGTCTGSVEINYTVADLSHTSNTAKVIISIISPTPSTSTYVPPVEPTDNLPPVSQNVTRSARINTPYSGQLTAVDPNEDPVWYQLVNGPTKGDLTFNPDGTYTLTPSQNFVGTISFVYQSCDTWKCSIAKTVTISFGETIPNTGLNDIAFAFMALLTGFMSLRFVKKFDLNE